MTPRSRSPWMLWLAVVAMCGSLIGCGTGPILSTQNRNSSQVASTGNPSPSGNLPSPASPHTVSLSWQLGSSSHVIGYNVYRGLQPGSLALLRSMQSGTRYVDTAVQDGNTYYYVVMAINSGGAESLSSNIAEAIIPPAGSPAANAAPANAPPANSPPDHPQPVLSARRPLND